MSGDPAGAAAALSVHEATYWLMVDTDPGSIDPVRIGVLLATLPHDDPRFIAARIAVELRVGAAELRQVSLDLSRGYRAQPPIPLQQRLNEANARAAAWQRRAHAERQGRRNAEIKLAGLRSGPDRRTHPVGHTDHSPDGPHAPTQSALNASTGHAHHRPRNHGARENRPLRRSA